MSTFGYLLPTRGSVLSSDDPETLAAKTQADIVQLAKRAEQSGFESVWIGDSIVARPRHAPLVTLASVAAATEAVTLGTAVYLPALRHPVVVAHQTATLDQLSGGRFVLGVGAGSGSRGRVEHENLGVPFYERGAYLNESLEVLTQLWGGEPIDFEGEYHSLADAGIGFQPCSDIPIYVGSRYDPDRGFPVGVRERLVRFGDGWFPTRMTPDQYETGISTIRELVREADRDPDGIDTVLYLDVVIGDTTQEARDKTAEFVEAYYPGEATENGMVDGFVEHGAIGTPDRVREQITAFERAGVETFVVRFATTNQRDQFQRFATLFQ